MLGRKSMRSESRHGLKKNSLLKLLSLLLLAALLLASAVPVLAEPLIQEATPTGDQPIPSVMPFSDFGAASLKVDLDALTPAACSPLPCNQILVYAPYALDWSNDEGKIQAAGGAGTGFTYLDQPPNGTGYIPANLTVDTSGTGTLKIKTTAGININTVNSQDNTLAVGVKAPDQISVLDTTLVSLPALTGNFEQAGLWFGINYDNYVKLIVMSDSDGLKIQYLVEVNGQQVSQTSTAALNLSGARVGLRLRASPTDRSVIGYYSINGADPVELAAFVVPGEFFSFDAAGIDPAIGTRSFGGIFATSRNSAANPVFTFDDFSLTAEPVPTLNGKIGFDRVSFSVPNPTGMAWGPDGRLYVTELLGKIHAITLNAQHQVTDDQVITTLGSRMTLGIAVDPASTPSNVILWVSHSSPDPAAGQLNSGTISRLSGAGFTTRQDVITGLPRAYANHATNSIHFGPDGRLYLAQGGNTGAGAPNNAATEFGTRAEQPLSAAFLVADVKAAGFDGTCATPENTFSPAPCDVQVYASGLRNMYDFVFHSNGSIYGPDNGLGVLGSFPPSTTPPCTGVASVTLWNAGGQNPGAQADSLMRVLPNKYYGHPNPYRNECVFKTGSYQGVGPAGNYEPPMYSLGMNRSADGVIEYTSNAIGGMLKGDLLITEFSTGNDVRRITLSADGRSVVADQTLASGFNDPLPIVQGSDGVIYVGEFTGNQVTVLDPQPVGSWTTRASMPSAILDAGGAALGGKLYVVGGKTTGDVDQRTLYIYNAAMDSWTQGPNLPAAYPAVENPVVVAYNNKLYAFGGSTSAFSGATTHAAVYDPATNAWTMLASMPVGRTGATGQALGNLIYVVGGMGDNGASLASVAIYNPASNTWSAGVSMATRRDNPGSAVLGGKLYVFGGRTREADGTETEPTLNTTEMFDPATNAWAAKASMPTGRRTMAVGMLDGKAQLMGGEKQGANGTFSQNEEYDPATNTWRMLTPMLTPRHGTTFGTIGEIVYVAGGGPQAGSSFTAVTQAFTFLTPQDLPIKSYLPLSSK